jgi:hypothetical protein
VLFRRFIEIPLTSVRNFINSSDLAGRIAERDNPFQENMSARRRETLPINATISGRHAVWPGSATASRERGNGGSVAMIDNDLSQDITKPRVSRRNRGAALRF